jgi:hypothetical protein
MDAGYADTIGFCCRRRGCRDADLGCWHAGLRNQEFQPGRRCAVLFFRRERRCRRNRDNRRWRRRYSRSLHPNGERTEAVGLGDITRPREICRGSRFRLQKYRAMALRARDQCEDCPPRGGRPLPAALCRRHGETRQIDTPCLGKILLTPGIKELRATSRTGKRPQKCQRGPVNFSVGMVASASCGAIVSTPKLAPAAGEPCSQFGTSRTCRKAVMPGLSCTVSTWWVGSP